MYSTGVGTDPESIGRPVKAGLGFKGRELEKAGIRGP